MIFACPKCKKPLSESGGVAKCSLGHSFDRSREGYYNLLLGSIGGTHGDNREMIEARRHFLALGHYYPLAQSIAKIVAENINRGSIILDAGLGEGYYTELIAAEIKNKLGAGGAFVIGFDISKDAVKRASKRAGIAELAVASAYRMPLADGCVDLIVNVFSPLAHEESLRVLKPGGYFLMAIPAEEHLFGLKEKIYDTPYKNTPQHTSLDGFNLVSKKELRYSVTLDKKEDITSLFMMTPYAYRTSREGRERVLSLDTLSTEAHFILLLYKKL